MSRIGRLPIQVPKGVDLRIESQNHVTVKGPKGTLTRTLHPEMLLKQEDGVVTVQRPSDSKLHRSLHGLTRTLLNNMVVGVTTGFKRELDIVGVGYRAEVQGRKLILNLGFSHPVEINLPEGIDALVERKNKPIDQYQVSLTLSGRDKEALGELTANIRGLRKTEPYKGKGIRYEGERVRRKAGKTGKK